nr:MAG TPA: hypothetical protein [Caudoviricetes sp.]
MKNHGQEQILFLVEALGDLYSHNFRLYLLLNKL